MRKLDVALHTTLALIAFGMAAGLYSPDRWEPSAMLAAMGLLQLLRIPSVLRRPMVEPAAPDPSPLRRVSDGWPDPKEPD
jgi:hypothetical protein